MPIIGQPAHTHFTPAFSAVALERISLSVTYLYNISAASYRVSLVRTYIYNLRVIVSRSQTYLYNVNPVTPIGPTRLYLHAALNPLPNLPDMCLCVLVPNKFVDAETVNRTMGPIISGTAQSTLTLTSNGTTTPQVYYFSRYVTDTFTQVSSIQANTWKYNFATNTTNPNSKFPVNGTNKPVRVVAYVWRPSTQSKVGDIIDGNTASTVDFGTTEYVSQTTFSGNQVLGVQDGDVLCFEAIFEITQSSTAVCTDRFFYDGTTVNITKNAAVTNHASFIETPQGLAFGAALTRVSKPSIQKYNIIGRLSPGLLQVYRYNVSALASLSPIYRYNITSAVSLPSSYLYSLTGRLSVPSTNKYNILLKISAPKIFRYALQSTTLFSRIYRYNIANKIPAPLSTVYKYNITSAVSLARIYHYNINLGASLARLYRYSITGRVAVPRVVRYNIANSVSLSRIYRYALGLGTSLTSTYKYNILNRLTPSASKVYKYNILTRLVQSRIYKYNILVRLLSVLTRIYRYNILIQKQKTAVYLYSLIARVSLSRIYKYRLGDGGVSLSPTYLYNITGRISKLSKYNYKIVALALPAIWKLTGQNTDFPGKLEDLVKDYLITRWSIIDPSLGSTPIITTTSSPKQQAQIDNFDYDSYRTYYLKINEVKSNVTTRKIRYNTYEFETPIEVEVYSRRLKKGEAYDELNNIINELMRIFGTYQKEEIFGIQGITLEGVSPVQKELPTPAQTVWIRRLRIILHYYKQSLTG